MANRHSDKTSGAKNSGDRKTSAKIGDASGGSDAHDKGQRAAVLNARDWASSAFLATERATERAKGAARFAFGFAQSLPSPRDWQQSVRDSWRETWHSSAQKVQNEIDRALLSLHHGEAAQLLERVARDSESVDLALRVGRNVLKRAQEIRATLTAFTPLSSGAEPISRAGEPITGAPAFEAGADVQTAAAHEGAAVETEAASPKAPIEGPIEEQLEFAEPKAASPAKKRTSGKKRATLPVKPVKASGKSKPARKSGRGPSHLYT